MAGSWLGICDERRGCRAYTPNIGFVRAYQAFGLPASWHVGSSAARAHTEGQVQGLPTHRPWLGDGATTIREGPACSQLCGNVGLEGRGLMHAMLMPKSRGAGQAAARCSPPQLIGPETAPKLLHLMC